jgi:hypothetical protein
LPGQRVYYVPPRLVGSVANWSGKDAPDGRSWLLDRVQQLGFNTIWFSPFFETSHRLTVNDKGEPVGKSLYATRHHGVLDPEFSATPISGTREQRGAKELAAIDALDRAHLDYFMAQAKRQGIAVMAMADLVFNHLASDHPLVLEEEAEIEAIQRVCKAQGESVRTITTKTKGFDGREEERVIGIAYVDHGLIGGSAEKEYYFKFCRNAQLETLNIGMTTGYDTAQINYASPASKEFFVTGTNGRPGYWKQVIDWCMDRGLKDFRCDIAFRVPPDWWQEIITHARARNPEAVFMAETLGAESAHEYVRKMADIRVTDADGRERPGFDLGMISNYWWNFTDDWLPEGELPRLRKMAKYGGASSPDNHDTPETLAGHFQRVLRDCERRDKAVADICARNYAVSALIANSVYMQMGYEYCKEKQNGVFEGQVTPKDWDLLVEERAGKSTLDITARIREINALKESMGVANCYVEIREHKEMQDGRLVKLACDYIDADTGIKTAEVVLIINKKPESGPVPVTDGALLTLESSGLQRFGAMGDNRPIVGDVVIYHTPIVKTPDSSPAPQRRKAAFAMAA